ncbi:FMN-binding negative transcriptional regulator [Catenulispora subtropica]|uniref:FMN-binding negative transcriptional regulator n=2 Tax=Catenulispora subtropica TaxID=450798 RepID=A0ABP5DRZ7_9ACTN
MADLVRDNPLALAVTNGTDEAGPFATHLPVIPDPATGETLGDLAPGTVLLGHMNRANPHWKSLRTGDLILLAFTGPHAYVSPTVYEMTPAAPTWNFTSVHVRGTVQTLEAGEETLAVVRATARMFEARFGAGWDQTESVGYFREIVAGVGAFRVTVTAAEGMFKLSQEQPADVRDRVRRSFGAQECTRRRAVADLMARLPEDQKG